MDTILPEERQNAEIKRLGLQFDLLQQRIAEMEAKFAIAQAEIQELKDKNIVLDTRLEFTNSAVADIFRNMVGKQRFDLLSRTSNNRLNRIETHIYGHTSSGVVEDC